MDRGRSAFHGRQIDTTPDRLKALREAGFATLTDAGWCLTAAGGRRIRPHASRLRAELAEICGG
jgi:hypothetical protein